MAAPTNFLIPTKRCEEHQHFFKETVAIYFISITANDEK